MNYLEQLELARHLLYHKIERASLIGRYITDLSGSYAQIVDLSANSWEVLIPARSENGISCKNWYSNVEFNRRFKI